MVAPAPAALDEERFEALGRLGEGGMGVVYRVLDQRYRREVALKTLSGSSARDLYRFKREFRSLTDLVHPNLCTLHELHTTGDEWFFTMELVHGVTFIDWVRPSRGSDQPGVPDRVARTRAQIAEATCDLARLERALGELADGLLAIHAAGKLHRDLKPSNVLCEADGRLVLLDFGLVADVVRMTPEQTHVRAAVGTPAYMSPEQAKDVPLDAASDWYAVGVMLYEALTGRRPFEGAPDDVLRRKQHEAPVPPGAIAPEVPAPLEALCLALLDPDPRRRADGDAVLATLGREPSEATRSISLAAAASTFVGRTAELAALADARGVARRGGTVVIVRGRSGMGKSSLLAQFVAGLGPTTTVLAGRCYEREHVPYKTLDVLIDALANALLAMTTAERARVLPRELPALARLFPVLRRLPELSEPLSLHALPTDPHELRARGWAALRQLLSALAERSDVVIVIDDLQWGDLDSVGFLADLACRPDRPPVLLVLAHREEDAAGPVITELERRLGTAETTLELHTITLPPLSSSEAALLVTRILGEDRAAEVATLVREAGGHAMLLAELAQAATTGTPHASLDQLLAARIGALPPAARALLVAAAVAGRAIDLAVAARAAGVDDAVAALVTLRGRRLVRTGAEGVDDLEPIHDRIRAAAVATQSPEALRACHLALAEAYRATAPDAHERQIDHLLAAGREPEAADAAATAAVAAERVLAFQRAADLYGMALAHGAIDDARRGELLVARARTLSFAGRLIEAAAEYGRAIPLAPESQRLELARQRTEQTLRAGRLVEGLEQARALLAQLGYRLPANARAGMWALIRQRVLLRLRGLRTRPVAPEDIRPEQLAAIDALWSVAAGLSFANPVFGRLVQMWHLRAALRLGEPSRVVTALSLEVGYLASTGGLRERDRVARLAERSRLLAARHGDPYLVDLIDCGLAFAEFMFGDFDTSRARFEAVLPQLRHHRTGDRWQLDLSEIFLLAGAYYAGNLGQVVELTLRFLADANHRGDVYSQHGLRAWRSNVVWLILDRPDEARRHVREVAEERGDTGEFHVNEWYAMVAEAQVDLYTGVDAQPRLDVAAEPLRRSQLLRLGAIRIETAFLEARAALAAAHADAAAAPRHVARARAAGRRLDGENFAFARALGALVTAGIALAEGDRAAAERDLVHAEAMLEGASLRFHAQVARFARGELVGGAAGAALAGSARTWMTGQRVVDPDRLSHLFLPRP